MNSTLGQRAIVAIRVAGQGNAFDTQPDGGAIDDAIAVIMVQVGITGDIFRTAAILVIRHPYEQFEIKLADTGQVPSGCVSKASPWPETRTATIAHWPRVLFNSSG